jgi:hypothetical protein
MTEAELAKCFALLDAVRRDGANVDAVGVDFLEQVLNIDRELARDVVVAWAKTYSADQTPEQRAGYVRKS